MTLEEIRSLAGTVLSSQLAQSGLETFTIRLDENSDGEPSIFIEAFFEGAGRRVDVDELIRASVEIRDALQATGDMRSPYLRPHIPDHPRACAA